jgi:hypothetical protein
MHAVHRFDYGLAGEKMGIAFVPGQFGVRRGKDRVCVASVATSANEREIVLPCAMSALLRSAGARMLPFLDTPKCVAQTGYIEHAHSVGSSPLHRGLIVG